jgi:hypothetical protein
MTGRRLGVKRAPGRGCRERAAGNKLAATEIDSKVETFETLGAEEGHIVAAGEDQAMGCRLGRVNSMRMTRIANRIVRAGVVLVALACARDTQGTSSERLESDAASITRFLTGESNFDSLELADSVDLLIAPDGGGGRARLSRDQLRDRMSWQVQTGGHNRSFLPPAALPRLVTAPGQYMNCQPSEIGTRFPQLANSPHVGVRLEPTAAHSCMQTWNATFVFDTAGGSHRLVAAIYDQWEW